MGSEKVLMLEMPFKDSALCIATDILEKLSYSKTSDFSEMIRLAQETFAAASGYYILPAPKWETKAKAYKPIECRNYIIGFAGSVAFDIRMYASVADGDNLWLKSVHKEWLIDKYKEAMLYSFDVAYRQWQKRKNMSGDEISESRKRCVERYNRTFREDPNMGRGVFFADQLEKICS